MSSPYEIKSGDTLTLIAKLHGLKSWREIYDLPENAAFRKKRPNPDRIFPGDVVMIPDHRIGPVDPSEVFMPPLRDHMPGFDVRAKDGTIIDLPVRLGRPFNWLDLDGDPADVFIDNNPDGQPLYVVVIQHSTDLPGPGRKIAPAVAQGIAKAAAKTVVSDLPKAAGFAVKWGIGKLAGGVVSIIASIIDPSPIGNEFVWNVKRADGKAVRYTVVVIGSK
jgi:hypothetical protein